jgi:predicted PurR-regulated permease PerM
MKFSKKYTSIAGYACLVILFAIVCIYVLLEIEGNQLSGFGETVKNVVNKILIGALIAYILNPLLNLFEYLVFVKNCVRKEVFAQKSPTEPKKRRGGQKITFNDRIEYARRIVQKDRLETYQKKLDAYENSIEKDNLKFLGKKRKRKEPQYREHPYRGISLLCTYVVFFAIVVMLGWAIIPQFIETLSNLINLIKSFGTTLPDNLYKIMQNEMVANVLDTIGYSLEDIANAIKEEVVGQLNGILSALTGIVTSLYQAVYNLLIGLILSIYFLVSKELLQKQFSTFIDSFFNTKVCYWIRFIFYDVDAKFGRFIEGKLVDSLIVGILSFVVFWLFKIPYAAMIALIVGVTNVIPFFGPFIGAIPSAAVVLIVEPKKLILFIILIILIQQIDGNLIGPQILGDSLELPPVWIICAIIIMGGLFGFAGMFFGVPIFAVIMTIIKEAARLNRAKKERKVIPALPTNEDPFPSGYSAPSGEEDPPSEN